MEKQEIETNTYPTISDLYPQLSLEEQKEAEENLKQYLEVMLRIYERLELAKTSRVQAVDYPEKNTEDRGRWWRKEWVAKVIRRRKRR